VHLACPNCQQVLQGPKTVLNPVATPPRSYEPWRTDGCGETHHVELIRPVRIDHDERHHAICRTGGSQPRIAHTRDLGAVTPGPIAWLLQLMALHLVSVGQRKDIRTFPFHKEGPLVGGGDMAHELGITKPTIRDDYWRGQCHAASAECCQASIQHTLHPTEFISARRPRAGGVGTTDGKVNRYHEFAIADDDHQEDPINAREHPVFLATPPGAHQAQLLAILFEHGVITHPGPLPAAACGRTLAGSIAPQRDQHVQSQTSQSLDPRALGQRTEQA